MARTSNNELKEMLEQIDVEDYLCHLGVDFKITHGSSGVQANVRECPRCGGTSWKVYLGVESGLGNCFHGSCQGEPGFNIFSFSKYYLGSSKDAFKEINGYVETNGWVPARKKSAPVSIEANEVVLPKSYPLPIQGKNLKYLAARGISTDVAEYLGLRYCKQGKYRYTLADKKRWQNYDSRVIIPIFDLNGDIVTFQGRDITETAEQKYLFPPGLSGTGRYLYNAHNVVGNESIVISEGAFDVAAVLMAFEEDVELRKVGVVGSFGKNLSLAGDTECQLTQLMHLKQYGLRQITFMWDGESKAIDAACKQAMTLKSYGFSVRVAILPDDKDPNEVEREVVRLAYYRSEPVTAMTMAKLRLRLMK